MKSFRQLSLAAVLTLVLAISALAGDIQTPTLAGEIGTPGVTGEIGCPGIAGDVSTPGIVQLLLSLMGF